jgi:Zn-dependent protease with chaperone function
MSETTLESAYYRLRHAAADVVAASVIDRPDLLRQALDRLARALAEQDPYSRQALPSPTGGPGYERDHA